MALEILMRSEKSAIPPKLHSVLEEVLRACDSITNGTPEASAEVETVTVAALSPAGMKRGHTDESRDSPQAKRHRCTASELPGPSTSIDSGLAVHEVGVAHSASSENESPETSQAEVDAVSSLLSPQSLPSSPSNGHSAVSPNASSEENVQGVCIVLWPSVVDALQRLLGCGRS